MSEFILGKYHLLSETLSQMCKIIPEHEVAALQFLAQKEHPMNDK